MLGLLCLQWAQITSGVAHFRSETLMGLRLGGRLLKFSLKKESQKPTCQNGDSVLPLGLHRLVEGVHLGGSRPTPPPPPRALGSGPCRRVALSPEHLG